MMMLTMAMMTMMKTMWFRCAGAGLRRGESSRRSEYDVVRGDRITSLKALRAQVDVKLLRREVPPLAHTNVIKSLEDRTRFCDYARFLRRVAECRRMDNTRANTNGYMTHRRMRTDVEHFAEHKHII